MKKNKLNELKLKKYIIYYILYMCDCHFKNKDGSSWSYEERLQ